MKKIFALAAGLLIMGSTVAIADEDKIPQQESVQAEASHDATTTQNHGKKKHKQNHCHHHCHHHCHDKAEKHPAM